MELVGIYDKKKQILSKKFFLELIEEGGYINLRAVWADGSPVSCGCLITIDKDKKRVIAESGINSELGFPLTNAGDTLIISEW